MPGPCKTVKRSQAPTTTPRKPDRYLSSERPASLDCAGPCRRSETKTDIAAGSKTTTSLMDPALHAHLQIVPLGSSRFLARTSRRHATKASLALPTAQDRYPIRPGSANLTRGASNAVDGAA